MNFYVDDEDVEEDFDDDAAFPESDDVEVKVINETKENQEKKTIQKKQKMFLKV